VVNGPAYGTTWHDYTAATREFGPLGKSFHDWYREWAEQKLRMLDQEPLLDWAAIGMTLDQLKDLLGGEIKTWAGSALLPGESYVAFKDASASFLIAAEGTVKKINRFSL
jgi:hypothetical protein